MNISRPNETNENETKLLKWVAFVAHSHMLFPFSCLLFLFVKAWASFYEQKYISYGFLTENKS